MKPDEVSDCSGGKAEDSGGTLNHYEFNSVLRWDWTRGVDLTRFKSLLANVTLYQVLSCIDVSVPKYRTGVAEDDEDEPEHEETAKGGFRGPVLIRSTRMLKVVLYDGNATAVAFEYEPIGAFDLFYDSFSNSISRCCVKIALYNAPVRRRDAFWLTNSNVKILFEGYTCQLLEANKTDSDLPIEDTPINQIDITSDIIELAEKCFDDASEFTKSTRTTASLKSSRLEDFVYSSQPETGKRTYSSREQSVPENTSLTKFEHSCPSGSLFDDKPKDFQRNVSQTKSTTAQDKSLFQDRRFMQDKYLSQDRGTSQSGSISQGRSYSQDRSVYEIASTSQSKGSTQECSTYQSRATSQGSNVFDEKPKDYQRNLFEEAGLDPSKRTYNLGICYPDRRNSHSKGSNQDVSQPQNKGEHQDGSADKQSTTKCETSGENKSEHQSATIRVKTEAKSKTPEEIEREREARREEFHRKLMEEELPELFSAYREYDRPKREVTLEEFANELRMDELAKSVEDTHIEGGLTDEKILSVFAGDDEKPKGQTLEDFYMTDCSHLRFSYLWYLKREGAERGCESFMRFSNERFLARFGEREVSLENFCKLIELGPWEGFRHDEFDSDYADYRFGFLDHASVVVVDGKSPLSPVYAALLEAVFGSLAPAWLAVLDDCRSPTFVLFTLDVFPFLSTYMDELSTAVELNRMEGFFLVEDFHIKDCKIRVLKRYARSLPSDDLEDLVGIVERKYREVRDEYEF